MSIQRAEELKREWTDRHVMVLDGVPELRRFQGLVGQVKTVNMNCRLLIEFDCPADISWYDVDPQFVSVVDPKQQEANRVAAAEKQGAKANSPNKPAKAAASSTGTVNPLDAIRASSGSPANAEKGPAKVNPLDAIRQGSSAGNPAKDTPSTNPLDAIRQSVTKTPPKEAPATDGNPLDQIRAQAAATPSTESAKEPATGDNPLDQIRAQAAATPSTESAKEPATGGNPLDQIRAHAAATPPTESAKEPATGGNPLDQIRAQAAGSAATGAAAGTGAAAVAGAIAADAAAQSLSNPAIAEKPAQSADPPESQAADAEPGEVSGAESPESSMVSTASEPFTKTTTDSSIPEQADSDTETPATTESALRQVHAQATNGDESIAAPNSLFTQVSEQARSESPLKSHSESERTLRPEPAADPVDSPSPSIAASPANTDDGAAESESQSTVDSPQRSNLSGSSVALNSAIRRTGRKSAAGNRKPIMDSRTLAGRRGKSKLRMRHPSRRAGEIGRSLSMTPLVQQPTTKRPTPPSPKSAPVTKAAAPAPESKVDQDAAGVEDPVKQTFHGRKLPRTDDLTVVEGIGPRIAELCQNAGIVSWEQLGKADPDRLRQILDEAGPRFRMHNPETWPQQSQLAHEGKWSELEELQDLLDGGRPPE